METLAAPLNRIQWTRFFLGCGSGLVAGYLWTGLCYAFAGYWGYYPAVFAGLMIPAALLWKARPRKDFRIGVMMGLAFILLLVSIAWLTGGPPGNLDQPWVD